MRGFSCRLCPFSPPTFLEGHRGTERADEGENSYTESYEVAAEALPLPKDLACDTLKATSLSVSNVNFRIVH
jgi:hypothetical protein